MDINRNSEAYLFSQSPSSQSVTDQAAPEKYAIKTNEMNGGIETRYTENK